MKSNVFIIDKHNKWKNKKFLGFNIFYSGYLLNYNFEIFIKEYLIKINKNLNKSNFILKEFNLIGNFAIIIKKQNYLFAVSDNISSIPIFYFKDSGQIYFSNSSEYLVKKFKKKIKLINKQIKPFLYSGYTIGKNTLFDKINFLSIGQNFLINKNYLKFYETHKINKKTKISKKKLKDKLNKLLDEIFSDTIKSLNNRQVVISLSAGYDSRLVLSMLKKLNYNNIICYSYGMRNNSESTIAQEICKKLGVKFYFDELKIATERKFYNSKVFKNYLNFSNMHHSVQYFQGISTLFRMKKKKIISEDSIIITGNGGDYISGLHLSLFLKEKQKNKKNIYNFILEKHYDLWKKETTKVNEGIKNLVREQHKIYNKRFSSNINLNDFYELYELENRQSKYVVNMNRVSEFLRLDWRMPLWDIRFVKYWNTVPDKFKINENLYVDSINEANPADVWRKSIPVNKKKVFPLYIRYLRNILKVFFIIFGNNAKKYWHQFDIKYLYYFYDVTRMMCLYPYKDYLTSNKSSNGFCHVSIQSKKYLEKYENIFKKV